jgi:hypothetical protein
MGVLSHQPKYLWPLYILVLRAQGPSSQYEPGSAADFDRLYRIAYSRVYRTLVAILADRAEAEDWDVCARTDVSARITPAPAATVALQP